MKLEYVNDEDQHAYYLDGKRAKGVTSIAKYPDNTYNLEQWAKRMVAIGLAMNPVYVDAVAAHFDDRDTLDKYVEKALVAAKAEHGSDRGTSVHRFTERHDLGEPILETPLSAYVVSSWQAALEAADLEVLPEYVERIVVHPDYRICGRLDRVLRRRSDGRLFIGDVKGGQRALQYPHAMACQLGLYANAPLIAGPIPDRGGETQQFDPMPDVDKEWGYIFHLPASGEAAVARVNIAAGWECVKQIIFPTITWRDRKDLCQPVATIVAGGEQVPVSSPVEPAAPGDVDRRNALIARVKDLSDEQRQELARRWPTYVPTFKASASHFEAELDAIELVLGGIDLGGAVGPIELPPEPPPRRPAVGAEYVVEEGDLIDDQTAEAIKATITALEPDIYTQVTEWAKEAHVAQRGFSLSAPRNRTFRRFEIMRAAIGLAPYPDDVVRAALGFVMGVEMQPAFTVGQALGSLTISEASRLALLAESLGTTIAVIYRGDAPEFDGPGLAAVAA